MPQDPSSQHFGRLLGFKHKTRPDGESCLELSIVPSLCNAHGTLHGGVIMAMLDTAGLWAIGSALGTPPRAVTVSLNCNFLSAPRSDQDGVRAIGRVTKRGRSLFFSDIKIEALPSGSLIATAQGVYAIVPSS